MSLLEGHADVVMDGVGPEVIPSVGSHPRPSFTERRKGVGTLDRLLRRLLGLDAKMAQYRDGARFVRAVVDKVGMDDFNAVWATRREPADQGRDRRPRRLGRPGPAVTAREPAPVASRPCGSPYAAGLADLEPGARLRRGLQRRRRLAGALASATVFEGRDQGWYVVGVTVDHGLQEGSAERAERVVGQMAALGVDETVSARVNVEAPGLGPEAAARAGAVRRARARSASASTPRPCCSGTPATTRPRPCCSAWPAAPAAARSPGCAARSTHYRRPLLDVSHTDTVTACQVEGLEVWEDPHNDDPAFTRVRVRRRVLPLLEDELGPGRRRDAGPHRRPAARRHGAPRRVRRARRCARRPPVEGGLPVAALAGLRGPDPDARAAAGGAGRRRARRRALPPARPRRRRAGHRLARPEVGRPARPRCAPYAATGCSPSSVATGRRTA